MPLAEVDLEAPTPLRLSAPPEPSRAPQIIAKAVLDVLGALAAVLAIRLILTMAVVGGIWLAYLMLPTPSVSAVVLFGVYTASVLAPLVWLASRRD